MSFQAVCAGIETVPKQVLFGVTSLMLSNQHRHPDTFQKWCFYVRRCLEKMGVGDAPGVGLGAGVDTTSLLMALGLGFKRGVSGGKKEAKEGLQR